MGGTTKIVTEKKSSPKSSPSHPPYIQMITEALVALKERTGSSHYAIAKHIEEEQKIKDLPGNFKKLLSVQLKKNVASGKLVMVKKSFKLPPKSATAATTKVAKPKAAEKKVKKPTAAASSKVVKPKAVAVAKTGKKKSLKAVKSPMKKAAKAVVAKAKKPKSIKSPVKKKVAATAAATTKKAKK